MASDWSSEPWYLRAKKILSTIEDHIGRTLPNNVDYKAGDFIHPYDILNDPSFFQLEQDRYGFDLTLYKIDQLNLDFLCNMEEIGALTGLNIEECNLAKLPVTPQLCPDLSILRLRNCQLVSIREDLGEFRKLYTLDLSTNQLTHLPSSLRHLTRLNNLCVKENKLTVFPNEICTLPQIEDLDLSNNQISKIPSAIGQCQGLWNLKLRQNRITSLPASIGDLKALVVLYLDKNQLQGLPESLGKLKKLTRLIINSNRLNSLPDSIGNLERLVELNLENNKLTSLPDSIRNLESLEELHLESNELTSIPESIQFLRNLKKLFLNNNHIASLPIGLGLLENLECLYLGQNPINDFSLQDNSYPKLQHLDFSGVIFQSFSFLSKFPALDSLELSNFHWTTIPSELIAILLKLPKLKDLYLFNHAFKTYPRELLPLLKKSEFDIPTMNGIPISVEELFFLDELTVADFIREYDEWPEDEGAREQFTKQARKTLIEFLELGSQFLPILYQKLTDNEQLTALDYHHPELLLKMEEISEFCTTHPTNSGRQFRAYLQEHRRKFELWQEREKKNIQEWFAGQIWN